MEILGPLKQMLRVQLIIFLSIVLSIFMVSINSFAGQPVMDMAPRWEGGYGFQLRYESYGSDILLDGVSKIDNPLDIKNFVDKIWLEGVYTFDRSKRITFKLPFIGQVRTKTISGIGVKQKNSGVSDLVIGLPLKKYFNRGSETSNWGFTPSLRLPTGSYSGDYPLSDGSWDLGLGLSYSTETFKFYSLYDLFYWYNTEGKRNMREGNEIGFDINWGIHAYHNSKENSGMFLMWDIGARHHEKPNAFTLTSASGGTHVHTGPVLMLYRETMMFHVEYKWGVYEKMKGINTSKGNISQISAGITF